MASNGSLKRSVGVRLRDLQDVEHSQIMTGSNSSVAMDEEIQHKPFEMEFEMSENEMAGLADAFNRYMDVNDKTISFNELFHDLKQIGIKQK